MRKIAFVFLFLSWIAAAEVVDKSATGFTIKITSMLPASPEHVYNTIVDVGSWWESSHTYSGSARNMSIAPKAGGCFCEKLPNGGEVQHGTVVFVQPGQALRLLAALGPLQSAGIAGALTFELAPSGANTQLTITYSAGGYMQGGIENIAEPANQMLTAQIASLKARLERK